MEYNSIYGYIKIDRDYHKSVDFIKRLGKDEHFPFINTNMFSFGDPEIPYYYENHILSFAATYKYFGLELSDWNDFILKIEHILRNIDFDSAQFHIESAIGDYTLYWMKQKNIDCKEYKLTETSEWLFGFGKRSVFVGYPDKIEEYEDLRNAQGLNFVYPVPLPDH